MKLAVNILCENGIKLALKLGKKAYDTCIFGCRDLHGTIDALKNDKRRNCRLFVRLQSSDKEKFALLYDFVDAFIISDFDDLSESIDPLINLRMYNDEYREIYIKVPDNFLYEELDEIISYSLLSNVDGIVISNPRLINYASKKIRSSLKLIADAVDTPEKLRHAIDGNADTAVIPYAGKHACFISGYLSKRWTKQMSF